MTSMILRMDACLKVEVGMRVYYNCPSISGESFAADNFFRKYQGREGTIVGFSSEFVPPLDDKGRLPGVYYTTGGISVQFDGEGEVHNRLNIKHFVLMSPANTAEINVPLTHQRAGDLPNPILFYPGDIVHKSDDLLKIERLVERVSISKEGSPVYILAEAQDDTEAREAEDEKRRSEAREKGRMIVPLVGSFTRTEHVSGDQITLLWAGNVHRLYTDPSKMWFPSSADEIQFWSREGLSKTVYAGRGMSVNWEYSYEKAREMLEAGEGDLIVKSKDHKYVVVSGRSGDHKVRRIHDCFGDHRDRVRELSLALEEAPGEAEWTLADVTRSLMRM